MQNAEVNARMPELQIDRVVEIVVDELLRSGIGPRSAVDVPVPRMAGATPDRIAAVIDHTLLKPDATLRDVERLCREALEFAFATVCVNPVWVPACAALLRSEALHSSVPESQRSLLRRLPGVPGVCSVVGFPLGANTIDAKAFEARRAIGDGATEIDMVLNVGALKSGDLLQVARGLQAVVGAGREAGVPTKVIIETALLTADEKVAACTIARAAGAAFVKTSTGFAAAGATVDDVRLMRRVVGDRLGVKASGGIRDLATARAMLDAGATRIGTGAGVEIVREAAGDHRPAPAGRY
jgi:deoxyribose-phosphate aldolase